MRPFRKLKPHLTGFHAPYGSLAFFLDLNPRLSDFQDDVIDGLSLPQKAISPKYFYDARGSRLFEEITRLEAYYPTRTEQAIVAANARDISDAIGARRSVFEYGSGSSEKIRRLVSLMRDPLAYVAVDISREHLIEAASALAADLALPVGAVCADFNTPIDIPPEAFEFDPSWVGYFPGSTLGNLSEEEAGQFLARANLTLGPGSCFLLGVDLEKNPAVLQRAYDDPEGVTADFNLNLLRRMRRDFGADLDIADFRHVARVEENPQRVEMHLEARRATAIRIGEREFSFHRGETIHTENSNKFTVERLDRLAGEAGWRRIGAWTDNKFWFATCLFSNS